MGKNKSETKYITHYGNTNKYATAVIKGDNGMTIKADGMTYSYDRGNNILMLTDSYGTTKYKPLFVGELIFPFNQRVESEVKE